MKQQAVTDKAYIEAQEAEQRKLMKIITEADAERVRQKKELDQVGHYFFFICNYVRLVYATSLLNNAISFCYISQILFYVYCCML